MHLMNLECQLYLHGATSGLAGLLVSLACWLCHRSMGQTKGELAIKNISPPNTSPVSVKDEEQEELEVLRSSQQDLV